MAEIKTQATDASVDEFLAAIPHDTRRADAYAMCELLTRITGAPAVMWGDAIVGFGDQHVRYESGRELDWFDIGFSPRKAHTTIYLSGGTAMYADLLAQLGNHKSTAWCLNITRLANTDLAVLEAILTRSVAHARTQGAGP